MVPGVGDQLGRYTLLKRLAVGGMGEVFVAARVGGPTGLGSLVALKVLRDELAVDQQFVDMLVDEANIAKHLNHQNLVSVLDLGEDSGNYYIAMEFVRGITAERLIESLVGSGRKLDVPLAVHIGIELCRALQYAHTRENERGEPLGIIHRDVTPANILLSTEGEVKLTDFGIARAIGRIHKTQAGVLKGKFGYMAPEMVRYESLDARADLFCVGVVLYLLAAGRHPVAQASVMEAIHRYESKRIPRPSSLNPNVPSDLDQVLMTALEPRPSMRWQNAERLGDALQEIFHAHSEWRASEQAMAAGLAHRIRQVAPEIFGDLVSKETIQGIADDCRLPRGWLPYHADLGSTSGADMASVPPWMKDEDGGQFQGHISGDQPWPEDDIPPIGKAPLPVVASAAGMVLHAEDPTLALVNETADFVDFRKSIKNVTERSFEPGMKEGNAPTLVPVAQKRNATTEGDSASTLLEGMRQEEVRQAIAKLDSVGASPTLPQGANTPNRSSELGHNFHAGLAGAPIAAGGDDATFLREPIVGVDVDNAPTFLRNDRRMGEPASLVEGLQDEGFLGPSKTQPPSPRLFSGQGDIGYQGEPPLTSGRDEYSSSPAPQSGRRTRRRKTERVVTLAAFAGLAGLGGAGLYLWFATKILWPELRITTQPGGASVLIDGREHAGNTPMVVKISPGQQHRIELRAEGYRPALRQITDVVQRARTYMLEVRMKRVSPVLRIGPVSARVFVNGQEVGRGQKVELNRLPAEGPVRIRVAAPRHLPHKLKFDSVESVPTSLDITLLRRAK
ncbi:MAG: protein kinase [Myxococcales bacterium]|nr:protein kinase [Myxococcales bacterium]